MRISDSHPLFFFFLGFLSRIPRGVNSWFDIIYTYIVDLVFNYYEETYIDGTIWFHTSITYKRIITIIASQNNLEIWKIKAIRRNKKHFYNFFFRFTFLNYTRVYYMRKLYTFVHNYIYWIEKKKTWILIIQIVLL